MSHPPQTPRHLFGFIGRTPAASLRRLITVADDFGLSPAVNEAVEIAARDGILTSASLMVGAPHAADAVRRAHALHGRLAVGLHLVVIEGPAILPHATIPDLVDATGMFPSGQLRLGVTYAFSPAVRRQLAAEIRAQFEAFANTGLPLDHANAHKHMHLHPTVGAMMIAIGREFGLRAIRIPDESARANTATQGPARPGVASRIGARALNAWTKVLRAQARRAGLLTNDSVLGLACSGHMTPQTVQAMLDNLLPGITEMYFHPAIAQDATLHALMPGYEHRQEFEALLSVRIPADCTLTSYGALIAA
jgi:hopanoid biosynthesis associated protein HpnK